MPWVLDRSEGWKEVVCYLVFKPVESCSDGHGFDVTLPVDPVMVAAGFAQGLV